MTDYERGLRDGRADERAAMVAMVDAEIRTMADLINSPYLPPGMKEHRRNDRTLLDALKNALDEGRHLWFGTNLAPVANTDTAGAEKSS